VTNPQKKKKYVPQLTKKMQLFLK